jgi:hypothetical protein
MTAAIGINIHQCMLIYPPRRCFRLVAMAPASPNCNRKAISESGTIAQSPLSNPSLRAGTPQKRGLACKASPVEDEVSVS